MVDWSKPLVRRVITNVPGQITREARTHTGLLQGLYEDPAIVTRDAETGNLIEIQRRNLGMLEGSRDQPAYARYDRETGEVIGEEWYWADVQTRHGELPSTWMMDEETGIITREEYWIDNQRHRLDGPALIVRDRVSGDIIESEWHVDGVRIPDQDDTNFAPYMPVFE